MIQTLLALAAIAVTPQRINTPNQGTNPPKITVGTIAYGTENQVANPGFELSFHSNPWTVPYAWADWDGMPWSEYNEMDDTQKLVSGPTTETSHSGSASFCFDLEYNNDWTMYERHSAVHQTLMKPTKVEDVNNASLWAWTNGEWWNDPLTMRIDVEYADGPNTTFLQDVKGLDTDGALPGKGFKKVDFKSSLRPGGVVTGIMISCDVYGVSNPALFIDDVMIGKKVPLVARP